MGIRIGNSKPPPSRTRGILPNNRGMSQVAQRKIDELSVSAARRSAEAIRTDGWRAILWIKNPQAQLHCNCRSPVVTVQSEINREASEDETFSHEDVEYNAGVFVDNEENSFSVLFGNYGTASDNNTSGNPGGIPDTREGPTLDADDPTTNLSREEPITDQDVDDILSSLFPGVYEGTPCQICCGTGKVNGMRYAYGDRKLLMVGDYGIDYKLVNTIVDTSQSPHRFVFNSSTSYVEWEWSIPPYFESVDGVRIRDNDEVLPLDLEIYINNQWIPFSTAYIEALKGAGGTIRLRITASEIKQFSHAEMLIRTVPYAMVQFPQLQRDVGGDVVEALIQTEFEVEPSVGALSRGTIIEVPEMGRLFMVTSVTNKMTAKNVIFGIVGSARVIQPSEFLNFFGWGHYSQKTLPYRHMEPHADVYPVGIGPYEDKNWSKKETYDGFSVLDGQAFEIE